MGFFRGLGRAIKPLVDVPKWMDAKRIASDASFISSLAKRIFKIEKAEREETFEQALERLNLTEKDIAARYKEFLRLSRVFFTVFIVLFLYIVYLTLDISGSVSWRAFLLSTIVSLIALVQFLRFNYWVYQIKERRLGCGFKEYFRHGILGLKR